MYKLYQYLLLPQIQALVCRLHQEGMCMNLCVTCAWLVRDNFIEIFVIMLKNLIFLTQGMYLNATVNEYTLFSDSKYIFNQSLVFCIELSNLQIKFTGYDVGEHVCDNSIQFVFFFFQNRDYGNQYFIHQLHFWTVYKFFIFYFQNRDHGIQYYMNTNRSYKLQYDQMSIFF